MAAAGARCAAAGELSEPRIKFRERVTLGRGGSDSERVERRAARFRSQFRRSAEIVGHRNVGDPGGLCRALDHVFEQETKPVFRMRLPAYLIWTAMTLRGSIAWWSFGRGLAAKSLDKL